MFICELPILLLLAVGCVCDVFHASLTSDFFSSVFLCFIGFGLPEVAETSAVSTVLALWFECFLFFKVFRCREQCFALLHGFIIHSASF